MRKISLRFVSVLVLSAAFGVTGCIADGESPESTDPSGAGSESEIGSVTQAASSGCNRDVCISLTTPSGGKVTVHGWAFSAPFCGHFQLTGPNGLNKNSASGCFSAGGAGPSWTVAAVVGQYCVTGWQCAGSSCISEGKPCENVE
jgi:hypothetical protein